MHKVISNKYHADKIVLNRLIEAFNNIPQASIKARLGINKEKFMKKKSLLLFGLSNYLNDNKNDIINSPEISEAINKVQRGFFEKYS